MFLNKNKLTFSTGLVKNKQLLKKVFPKFLKLVRIFRKCVAGSILKRNTFSEEHLVGCSSLTNSVSYIYFHLSHLSILLLLFECFFCLFKTF